MPRIFRTLVAHGCYHVINRGNNRSDVFLSPADYRAFLRLIEQAQERIPLRMLAFCVMPNHFHLVVSQEAAKDVSRWMHWLLTTHVHRHHLKYGTSGRIWQGRFKAFPIEQDGHLLTVMRYVERNALRSGLVSRAEQWPWGSLAWRTDAFGSGLVSRPPVPLPSDWTARVNAPQTPQELEALRAAVNRQRAYAELAMA
jgi:putative transposase